jgi:hypothetical protein
LGDISVLGRLGSWQPGGTAEGELRALQAGVRHTCKQKQYCKQLQIISTTGKNIHVEVNNQYKENKITSALPNSSKIRKEDLSHP